MDPADKARQGKDRRPLCAFAIVKISYKSRGEDSRAWSSGTGRSTCKNEDTSRPRSCAYGGSLSSLMVTATGCRAETARGWSRPRAVSRSGRLPPCSAGSRRRGCSPSRSSVADEGRSGVSGSCCTGTKTETTVRSFRVPFAAGGHNESARWNEHAALVI